MQLSQVVTSSGVLMHVYSNHREGGRQQVTVGGDFRVPQSPGVVSSSTGGPAAVAPAVSAMRPPAAPGPRCPVTGKTPSSALPPPPPAIVLQTPATAMATVKTEYARSPPSAAAGNGHCGGNGAALSTEEPTSSIPDLGECRTKSGIILIILSREHTRGESKRRVRR